MTEYSNYWNKFIDCTLATSVRISLVLLFLLACNPSQAQSTSVVLVYQADKSFSLNIAERIAKRLGNDQTPAKLIPLDALGESLGNEIDRNALLVCLGSEVTLAIHQAQIENPVLSLLIPKQSYQALLDNKTGQSPWSAVFINQPISRQLLLIKYLLGQNKTIGTLLGPYSGQSKPVLINTAKLFGQTLSVQEIDTPDQLIPSLKMLTQDSDVLLALPDPVVFNKNTIRGILLLSYRDNIPLIGFSRSYVRAGAVASLFSEYGQISDQAYNIVNSYLKNGKFSREVYYPDDFSVAINRKVARTLNINLKTEDTLIRLIKREESRQ